MRKLLITLSTGLITLPALAAFADDITAQLTATSATVYPQGASVTYLATMDLPQGSHRVLLPYQNQGHGFTPPRLKVSEGVSIGAINFLQNVTYDQDALLTTEQASAKAAFEAAKDALIAKQAQISGVKRGLAALDMQAQFLGSISGANLENPDPEQMRAMSQMILTESEGAIAKRLEISEQMEELQEELRELNHAQTEASRAFNLLSPPSGQGDMLAISIEVSAAVSANFKVDRIISDARWNVAYDLRLTYGDAADLQVERKVAVFQGTGQTWPDIDLTLSTASPFAQSAPSGVGGNLAAIFNAGKARPYGSASRVESAPVMMAEANDGRVLKSLAEPVMEAPITAGLVVDGLSLSYAYPRKVTLTSNEQVQLTLDAFSLPVKTSLRAIPRRDTTAFVMAAVTNDRDDPLLPGQATFYRDGVFIGRGNIGLIPAGGEEDLSFGAMESIRLTYTQIRRETGDSGIITSSNTREDIIAFSVQNLTGKPQKVRTLFALPYSEQEDLEISNRIRPNPTEIDVDDVRGVAAWDMVIKAGETQEVRLSTTLGWPKGQELNWNP